MRRQAVAAVYDRRLVVHPGNRRSQTAATAYQAIDGPRPRPTTPSTVGLRFLYVPATPSRATDRSAAATRICADALVDEEGPSRACSFASCRSKSDPDQLIAVRCATASLFVRAWFQSPLVLPADRVATGVRQPSSRRPHSRTWGSLAGNRPARSHRPSIFGAVHGSRFPILARQPGDLQAGPQGSSRERQLFSLFSNPGGALGSNHDGSAFNSPIKVSLSADFFQQFAEGDIRPTNTELVPLFPLPDTLRSVVSWLHCAETDNHRNPSSAWRKPSGLLDQK